MWFATILIAIYIMSAFGAWIGTKKYYKQCIEEHPTISDVMFVFIPIINTFSALYLLQFFEGVADTSRFFGLNKKKRVK